MRAEKQRRPGGEPERSTDQAGQLIDIDHNIPAPKHPLDQPGIDTAVSALEGVLRRSGIGVDQFADIAATWLLRHAKDANEARYTVTVAQHRRRGWNAGVGFAEKGAPLAHVENLLKHWENTTSRAKEIRSDAMRLAYRVRVAELELEVPF